MSAAATVALSEAARALAVLTADMRVSGLCQRQLTPIARIRDQLDTVAWLIDYETSPVDIPHNDCREF